MNAGQITHGRHCTRPAPQLRLSWDGHPEVSCPGCGRSEALDLPEAVAAIGHAVVALEHRVDALERGVTR